MEEVRHKEAGQGDSNFPEEEGHTPVAVGGRILGEVEPHKTDEAELHMEHKVGSSLRDREIERERERV